MFEHHKGFRVGDSVEFELRPNPDGSVGEYPRWDDDNDRGYTGAWCVGIVRGWDAHGTITVSYHAPSTGLAGSWIFRLNGFDEDRDGWLCRVGERPCRCDCGSVATWGTGPHSDWCSTQQQRETM